MTKYTATFEFGTDADMLEVEAWFQLLRKGFPEDVKATLKQEPMVLDLGEVTAVHAGNVVKFYSKRYGHVSGILESVFETPGDVGRVLVVDGKAYHLNFEVVTLSEW